MAMPILAIFHKANLAERAVINGTMEVLLRAILSRENERGRVYGYHAMEINLKANIAMISSMDGVNSLGKMGRFTKENLRMIFVMVKDTTSIPREKLANIYGKTDILIIDWRMTRTNL